MTKLLIVHINNQGRVSLSAQSAAAALKNHPALFMALLDDMLDAAEDEARRNRAERLQAATQLPLFGERS